jgi:hypothetical protein
MVMVSRLRYVGLFGSDPGSPRGEELTDLGTVVHVNDGTTATRFVGMPYQYTHQQ